MCSSSGGAAAGSGSARPDVAQYPTTGAGSVTTTGAGRSVAAAGEWLSAWRLLGDGGRFPRK